MCDKPSRTYSWTLFDTVLASAIAPFALMAVLGMIGAIFFSEPQ
jgi:hypothetical protein